MNYTGFIFNSNWLVLCSAFLVSVLIRAYRISSLKIKTSQVSSFSSNSSIEIEQKRKTSIILLARSLKLKLEKRFFFIILFYFKEPRIATQDENAEGYCNELHKGRWTIRLLGLSCMVCVATVVSLEPGSFLSQGQTLTTTLHRPSRPLPDKKVYITMKRLKLRKFAITVKYLK